MTTQEALERRAATAPGIQAIPQSAACREQKLVDIMFEVALTLHDQRNHFVGKDNEFVAAWVARQLRGCGFPTTPMGSSWGVLGALPPTE